MKDVLEKLKDLAEAQIKYADQQEEADNKHNERIHEPDHAVRRDLAERILEIIEAPRMKLKIISSYPSSVTVGNYKLIPGINEISKEKVKLIHWDSIKKDLRLKISPSDELYRCL
jgi:hypothetical protein|tara:strand:+ start:461 stop:805 length:345 start_codon:yes stop_codon:yes gene_type:complete